MAPLRVPFRAYGSGFLNPVLVPLGVPFRVYGLGFLNTSMVESIGFLMQCLGFRELLFMGLLRA